MHASLHAQACGIGNGMRVTPVMIQAYTGCLSYPVANCVQTVNLYSRMQFFSASGFKCAISNGIMDVKMVKI